MGTVRCGERVIHINMAKAGEGAGEIHIIRFLASMKPDVFHQSYAILRQPGDNALSLRPNAINSECDRLAKRLRQAVCNWAK